MSESKTWYSWIEHIDMFARPIRLHIHKKNAFQTAFSGILSLFVITVLVFSATTKIIDAIYQSNATFFSAPILSPNTAIELNSSNFIMALTINNASFSLKNSFYNFDFQQISVDSLGSTQVQSLGITECSKDSLGGYIEEIKGAYTYKMLCPVKTEYPIESNENKLIRISVTKCVSSSNTLIQCAPKADVDSFFQDQINEQSLPVSLYLTNNVLNLFDTFPQQSYLKRLDFTIAGGAVAKHSDIYLQEEIVDIEDNILNRLKKDVELHNSFSIEDQIRDQMFFSRTKPFLEIDIKKSEVSQRHLLSFTKIETILAFLGGLSKALIVLVSILAIPYNEFYYNLSVSNEIYEFETRPKEFYKTKSAVKTGSRDDFGRTFSLMDSPMIRRLDGIGQGTSSNNIERPNRWQLHREKMQKYFTFYESLLKEHQQLAFTFKEFCKRLLCCRGRATKIKGNLYSQAEQRLREDVDVITILKKLKDIDKLKQLLFDNDQLTLFDCKRPLKIHYLGSLQTLSRAPLVGRRGRRAFAGGNVGKKSLYLPERPLESFEQFNNLYMAYKSISKDQRSEFSPKLTEMLGPNILKIFEKLDSEYKQDINAFEDKTVCSPAYGMYPTKFIPRTSDFKGFAELKSRLVTPEDSLIDIPESKEDEKRFTDHPPGRNDYEEQEEVNKPSSLPNLGREIGRNRNFTFNPKEFQLRPRKATSHGLHASSSRQPTDRSNKEQEQEQEQEHRQDVVLSLGRIMAQEAENESL